MSGDLEIVVTDEHLATIAQEYLTDWKALRPHLGLNLAQEDDISKSSRDHGEQKRNFLYKWSETKGSEATYGALVDAANKIRNRKLADSVKALLEERSSTPSMQGKLIKGRTNN